jgi:hypothetical protein
MQHGVIHQNHPGYAFPGNRNKSAFPDYLLTFGDFWAECVEYPIPKERVIPVGYPYLEQNIDSAKSVQKKDQLLFLSQGTIGNPLSKFAVDLQEKKSIDFKIVYKLHPGEYDRWRTEYPWLSNSTVEVVDGEASSLYDLFAESRARIGVSSTAMYEGLAYGLETFVYTVPEVGRSILDPLLKDGPAREVKIPEDLVDGLSVERPEYHKEYDFVPGASWSHQYDSSVVGARKNYRTLQNESRTCRENWSENYANQPRLLEAESR